MTNAISNIVDDKRYIKSELTTDSSVKKVPFFFSSEHKVTSDIIKQEVKTYNGGVNQFILNSSALGVLGTNKLGDGSEWSFVWGSDTRGEWGTQRWGDNGSRINLRYVYPRAGIFIEPFDSNEFIQSGSNVLTNGDILRSKIIYKTGSPVTQVQVLDLDFTDISLELSNDNGGTWHSITDNTRFTFPASSTSDELKYRITASGDRTLNSIRIKVN